MTNLPLDAKELHASITENYPERLTEYAETGIVRHLVFTQSRGASDVVEVYAQTNEEKAVDAANFWDERMNAYITTTKALAAFEKNRIESMTWRERLDISVSEALARIDSMANAMNAAA